MTKPILAFVACLLFPMAIHAQSAPFDMTPQQLANPTMSRLTSFLCPRTDR